MAATSPRQPWPTKAAMPPPPRRNCTPKACRSWTSWSPRQKRKRNKHAIQRRRRFMTPLRVFITGASSGIGAALAAQYAAQGAILGLLSRRQDALDTLIGSLQSSERHRAYAADVRDHAAIAAAAQSFMAYAGGIDVVIANAGISHGTLTEYAEDLAVFESIIATN